MRVLPKLMDHARDVDPRGAYCCSSCMLLATYPLEHMAVQTPRVNPEPTWRLYDALADLAGVHRPVTVPDPRVLVDGLIRADGRRFAWLIRESQQEIDAKPRLAPGLRLATMDGHPVETVNLPPTEWKS